MQGRGPLVEQLRHMVRESDSRGVNMCQLAKLASIDRAQLTRLMQGTVAPGLATADKIARAAGYEFRAVKVRRQRKGKRQ